MLAPEGIVGVAHGLFGRSVALQPLRPEYADFFCEAALTGAVRWEWKGQPRSVDGFRHSLWDGVQTQLVAVDRATGHPAGLLALYGVNSFHGCGSMGMCFVERFRASALVVEAALLFIGHVFDDYALRRLYADMSQSTLEELGPDVLRLFALEARLHGHLRTAAGYEDKVILALDRDRWTTVGVPVLTYATGGKPYWPADPNDAVSPRDFDDFAPFARTVCELLDFDDIEPAQVGDRLVEDLEFDSLKVFVALLIVEGLAGATAAPDRWPSLATFGDLFAHYRRLCQCR